MLKYVKIINEETKACEVGLGTNIQFYQSIGMTEMEVEQAWNGNWYLKGYAPEKPQDLISKERVAELKQYLADTDYCILKIEEAIDEAEKQDLREKYAGTIKARREARIEINNLEK
jgi:hypothetical protein